MSAGYSKHTLVAGKRGSHQFWAQNLINLQWLLKGTHHHLSVAVADSKMKHGMGYEKQR